MIFYKYVKKGLSRFVAIFLYVLISFFDTPVVYRLDEHLHKFVNNLLIRI